MGQCLRRWRLGGQEIKFYWLIPITFSEMEFKKAHGLEALEDTFERAGFDYLNPQRQSVV